MTDTERVKHLRQILAPTIGWYRTEIETHGRTKGLDADVAYHIRENVSASDAQRIIEILAIGYDPRPARQKPEQTSLVE